MTERAADADSWDMEYARLAALSRNVDMAQAFDALYERLASACVMMRLVDVGGIASGVYRVRLEMLQSLGRQQMEWARAHWPEQFEKDEQAVKVTRKARDKRERARMN